MGEQNQGQNKLQVAYEQFEKIFVQIRNLEQLKTAETEKTPNDEQNIKQVPALYKVMAAYYDQFYRNTESLSGSAQLQLQQYKENAPKIFNKMNPRLQELHDDRQKARKVQKEVDRVVPVKEKPAVFEKKEEKKSILGKLFKRSRPKDSASPPSARKSRPSERDNASVHEATPQEKSAGVKAVKGSTGMYNVLPKVPTAGSKRASETIEALQRKSSKRSLAGDVHGDGARVKKPVVPPMPPGPTPEDPHRRQAGPPRKPPPAIPQRTAAGQSVGGVNRGALPPVPPRSGTPGAKTASAKATQYGLVPGEHYTPKELTAKIARVNDVFDKPEEFKKAYEGFQEYRQGYCDRHKLNDEKFMDTLKPEQKGIVKLFEAHYQELKTQEQDDSPWMRFD